MFRIKQCPESSLKVVSCADDFSDSSPYCIVPAQASDPRETNRPLLIIDRKDSQQPPPPPLPPFQHDIVNFASGESPG